MDIDVDWCLTCQRHFEGPTPYCSLECEDRAGPSRPVVKQQVFCTCDEDEEEFSSLDDDVIFHEIEAPTGSGSARWQGNDDAGIAAWAADIPPGMPEDLPASPCSYHPPRKTSASPSYKVHHPPPNLLKASHRIVPPSLCMTTPQHEPTPTSTPILTPPRHSSFHLYAQTSSQQASLGKTSSKSAQTDSSLSTPASSNPVPIMLTGRKPTPFDEMYTQVRSWVSPCPAVFMPPEVTNKRYPPIPRVESSNHLFISQHKPDLSRGRIHVAPAFVLRDDHLSFKARGRRSSRAAA